MQEASRKKSSCLGTVIKQTGKLLFSAFLSIGLVWILTLIFPMVNPLFVTWIVDLELPVPELMLQGIWILIPFLISLTGALIVTLCSEGIKARSAT